MKVVSVGKVARQRGPWSGADWASREGAAGRVPPRGRSPARRACRQRRSARAYPTAPAEIFTNMFLMFISAITSNTTTHPPTDIRRWSLKLMWKCDYLDVVKIAFLNSQ